MNKDCHCTICPLIKQHRKVFPSHPTVSRYYYDLVYDDLWGPSRIPTIYGERHFLSIFDDRS